MPITEDKLRQTFSEGAAQEIYQEVKASSDFLGFARRYAFSEDYFGVLPQHELTEILIIKMSDVKQKYQLQIDYQYGPSGLPSGYDYRYWKWYWGQTFVSGQEANEQWNISKAGI